MSTARRVYLSGDSVKEEAGTRLQDWINYNRLYRPGCALLVDGVVVELGYYTQADRAKLETLFAADRCTLMITNQAKERNEALIQQAVARGSRRSDAEEHIKCLVEGRSICLVRFVHCPVKTAPSPISPVDDGC